MVHHYDVTHWWKLEEPSTPPKKARKKRNRMPSKSKKQARTMAAAAHNPAFAKKVGIPIKVAKEFNAADAGTGILKKGKKK